MNADARFEVTARFGAARSGTFRLRGRTLSTPAFLPVGTYGSVKGIDPTTLVSMGAGMILANAFHLHDRPGADVVAALGGLHRFMQWDGLILTDSGGFQIFSLLDISSLDDEGVTFHSPVDGRVRRLGPREAVEIQLSLDSDIAMVLDHCPPLPSSRASLEVATRRTTHWARQALAHHRPRNARGQALFAIVQGGVDDELRRRSADELVAMDFDGYALGGLSVGEGSMSTQAAAARYAPLLPDGRLRYLMGVGRPADVLAAIASGIDVFDCVLPTRNGRHGTLFTDAGMIHLRNSRFRTATGPIDPACDCTTCKRWDVGVLRHLIMVAEPLGRALCTIHNLRYLIRLVGQAREAIITGTLDTLLARHGVSPAAPTD